VNETLHAIIGTAGHIDHGKTALVRALTGRDTDRLKEEKERGISIDLGFAALMVGDKRVGIVDVPGHERFIRNMLAGAHGIDLVLLTVAADDGVMPQTEEHLDIVHLLGVRRGVVALTKADLASPERLAAVREEVEILVAGTRLERAPIVSVSVVSGVGLTALRAEIERQLGALERVPPPGPFRLPVDRAFSLKGHGVVVTGTAVAGTIAVGAEVRVLPSGRQARVRTVEVHGASVASGAWGQRVALNLVGVERDAIARGHVVVDPVLTGVTDRFDARVEIRPVARKGVRNHARVRVHLGTAETMGKLVLLEGGSVLAPKSTAWVQLVLEQPLVALRGDRFILRAENGQATLGGGEVALSVADRHQRGDRELLPRLETVRGGVPGEAAEALLALARELALPASVVAERLNLGRREVEEGLRGSARAMALAEGAVAETWTTRAKWEALRAWLIKLVGDFHATNPLLRGVEMEEARTQLPYEIGAKLFRAVVDRLSLDGVLLRHESLIALPDHRVQLAAPQEALASDVEARLAKAGYTPPDLRTLEGELGVSRRQIVDVLSVLEKQGRVARVAPELYYAAVAIARARAALEEFLATRPEITAAEFRDCLDVSRKFSIALLDYFDRSGVTLRVGDARKLRRA